MRPSAKFMFIAARPATLLIASLALSACGGSKDEAGAGQKVEMRDMEVVDGTINDAMTDLDAARADGTALANSANAAQPGVRTARRSAPAEADEADQNAEAVAAE